MKIIKLNNGEEISISFYHKKEKVKIKCKKSKKIKMQLYPVSTACLICNTSIPNVKLPLAEGIAKCNPNDNFEYKKGRKLSLKRALEKLKLDKKERTLIWNSYL